MQKLMREVIDPATKLAEEVAVALPLMGAGSPSPKGRDKQVWFIIVRQGGHD